MATDSDDVGGYARPPKTTQFKKGQSGNPRGRPKGSRNLATAILAAANERVVIVENGKRKTITKLEAATKHLANKAASGNERAMLMLCNLMQVSEGRMPEVPGAMVSEDDRTVLANLAKRFSQDLAQAGDAVETLPQEPAAPSDKTPLTGSTP